MIKKIGSRCVFLGGDGLCAIHKHHGEKVKALACRLYPFHILKWDDGSASASLRFDCVAVSENRGKPLCGHLGQMRDFASELDKGGRRSKATYSKSFNTSTKALRSVAEAYKAILFERDISMGAKLNFTARLLDFHVDPANRQDIIHPQLEFEKDSVRYIRDHREDLEFTVLSAARPDKLLNMVFNYILSGFARVDEEVLLSGSFISGRLRRAWAILKFILDKGSLRDLGADYPDTKGLGPLNSMAKTKIETQTEIVLKRYMAVQLESLHFCGNPGLSLTFEEGMRHLLLAYPMIVACASLYAESKGLQEISPHCAASAVRIIDHTFYHSPFFSLLHVKKMTKWLTGKENFPKILRLMDTQELVHG